MWPKKHICCTKIGQGIQIWGLIGTIPTYDVAKSLILFLKNTLFWENTTLGPLYNMMLRFAHDVFRTSNYHKSMGFHMRYVSIWYAEVYTYF